MRKRTSTPAAPDTGLSEAEASVRGGASRRELLKNGAGLVAGAAAFPWLQSEAAGAEPDDETLEHCQT